MKGVPIHKVTWPFNHMVLWIKSIEALQSESEDPTSLRRSRWPSDQNCKNTVINIGWMRLSLDNAPKVAAGQPNRCLKKIFSLMYLVGLQDKCLNNHCSLPFSCHCFRMNQQKLFSVSFIFALGFCDQYWT